MSFTRTPKPAERHGCGITFPSAIAYTGEFIALDALSMVRSGSRVSLSVVNTDPRTLASTAGAVDLDVQNGRHVVAVLTELLDAIERDNG